MYKMKFFFSAVFLTLVFNLSIRASEVLEIYTPYTSVDVSPGSEVSYSIDVINHGTQTCNAALAITNVPKNWHYTLTASGMRVKKLAVQASKRKTLNLKMSVPYEVGKGYYTFYVKAGSDARLPLTIHVTSAGTNETEFTCDQKNMEGTGATDFTFTAVLKNKSPRQQQYALMATPPKGWSVKIKPNYKQATSTEIDANGTKTVSYVVTAPRNVKAGTFKIPVKAISGNTTVENEFEVVITGTYAMDFNTSSDLLSASTVAGQAKKIELVIKNTGTLPLKNIKLTSSKPKGWELNFDKSEIESLDSGDHTIVNASIKAAKKSIPGDYVSRITAKTDELNETLSFRIMVKTPLLIGWLGILIIIFVVVGVVMLMRKYGRR